MSLVIQFLIPPFRPPFQRCVGLWYDLLYKNEWWEKFCPTIPALRRRCIRANCSSSMSFLKGLLALMPKCPLTQTRFGTQPRVGLKWFFCCIYKGLVWEKRSTGTLAIAAFHGMCKALVIQISCLFKSVVTFFGRPIVISYFTTHFYYSKKFYTVAAVPLKKRFRKDQFHPALQILSMIFELKSTYFFDVTTRPWLEMNRFEKKIHGDLCKIYFIRFLQISQKSFDLMRCTFLILKQRQKTYEVINNRTPRGTWYKLRKPLWHQK